MTLLVFNNLLIQEQKKLGTITEEGKLIKLLSSTLPYLDRCYVVRQEAIHRVGTPDYIICFEGVFVGIELKDDQGVQSKLQIEKQQKISAAGGEYILADSVNPILSALNLIHKRNEDIARALRVVQ